MKGNSEIIVFLQLVYPATILFKSKYFRMLNIYRKEMTNRFDNRSNK